jgi:hypothetical protein
MIIVVPLALTWDAPLAAQRSGAPRRLADVTAVALRLRSVDRRLLASGLDTVALRAAVEQRLRDDSVPLAARPAATRGAATLALDVLGPPASRAAGDDGAAVVRTELVDGAGRSGRRLWRSEPARVFGLTGRALARELPGIAAAHMTAFVAAYRAARARAAAGPAPGERPPAQDMRGGRP